VTVTTEQVEANSTSCSRPRPSSLREIRDTGESVLQMAGRINHVSTQAQGDGRRRAPVAAGGRVRLKAVQNTIGGMISPISCDQIRPGA